MRRETVNRIRYVLEEWVPPALRDSAMMRGLFRMHWGTFIDDLEAFRTHITDLSPAQYKGIYERMPRIQDETDNSVACIAELAARIRPGKVCDVGCGTGYLINRLHAEPRLAGSDFTGVDFIIEEQTRSRHPAIRFVAAPIEALPFPDGHFDTVICTHVLEHILDIHAAIAELRRICARRLLIVVPLEREYRFTFNPHVHFFPYPHSFLRYILPLPERHESKMIGRDLLYMEDFD